MYSLSKEELRSFLVKYHCLDNYNSLSQKKNGDLLSPSSQIKELLRRIGSVQYDPLNVVGRNPDLVFQSRVSGYHTDVLNELLYTKRTLIDGWDKEMSIYLTADWPNFSRVRKRREEGARLTLDYRRQKEALSYLPQILEEIKNRGPLSARNIKLGACEAGRWGHRQVSGAALDYLYHAGKLGINNKQNAQKVYGLIENLLPQKILDAPDPFPNDDAFLEWYVFRRIGSMGAHWLRNGGGWLGSYIGDSALRKKTFAILEEKKLIVPIKVPEINETFYIRRKDVSLLNKKDDYDEAIRILAPLDNMLWDRLLVKKLFDFEYTWEVYVPEAKRKYGYYVLP
ncbi:MAG: winged helix DNA-binding domain-containing protein, partial [Treponema sp.]|nr:winged helix DNA-binding domain-containing protein [Treponema sp.]